MASKRKHDKNGWVEIPMNPISKIGVFPYLGSEIGAPNPDQIYYVYRSEEELSRPETIDSFKLLPFVNDHEWLGANGTAAEKKGIQGVIGEQVIYEAPYLKANLKILSNAALSTIDSGKIELSPAYDCDYEQSSGSFEGQAYDYKQVGIIANHLALVQEGRTGKDIRVLDHKTFTVDLKENTMTLAELLAAIAELSAEDKAKLLDSLKPTEDELPEEKTEDEDAEKTEDDAEGVIEAVVDALEAVVEGDEVAAEEAAADIAEEAVDLETTQAMDSMRKQIKKLQSQVQSMDEGAILKRIAKRDELVARVKPHTGTFDHAMMTHDAVAQYGVKKLGIKCAPGTEAIALDAWLQGKKPAMSQKAMDSKSTNSLKDKWGAK